MDQNGLRPALYGESNTLGWWKVNSASSALLAGKHLSRRREALAKLQFGHWFPDEQAAARLCQPASPLRGAIAPGAVGCYARARVHLPVKFRNEYERQPRFDRRRAPRSFPDRSHPVAFIRHTLR